MPAVRNPEERGGHEEGGADAQNRKDPPPPTPPTPAKVRVARGAHSSWGSRAGPARPPPWPASQFSPLKSHRVLGAVGRHVLVRRAALPRHVRDTAAGGEAPGHPPEQAGSGCWKSKQTTRSCSSSSCSSCPSCPSCSCSSSSSCSCPCSWGCRGGRNQGPCHQPQPSPRQPPHSRFRPQ